MEERECKKCGEKLMVSNEPNVVMGERPKERTKYWRHSDERDCNYREKA